MDLRRLRFPLGAVAAALVALAGGWAIGRAFDDGGAGRASTPLAAAVAVDARAAATALDADAFLTDAEVEAIADLATDPPGADLASVAAAAPPAAPWHRVEPAERHGDLHAARAALAAPGAGVAEPVEHGDRDGAEPVDRGPLLLGSAPSTEGDEPDPESGDGLTEAWDDGDAKRDEVDVEGLVPALGAGDEDDAPRFVDLCAELVDADDELACPEGHGGTVLLAIDGDAAAPVALYTRARREPSDACAVEGDLEPADQVVQFDMSRPAELTVRWFPVGPWGVPLDPEAREVVLPIDDDLQARHDASRAEPGFDPDFALNTWTCAVLDAPSPGHWAMDITAAAPDGGTGSARRALLAGLGTERSHSVGRPEPGRVIEPLAEVVPIDDTRAHLYLLDRSGRRGGVTGLVAALPRSGLNATDLSCAAWEAGHRGGDRSWDDRDQIITVRQAHEGEVVALPAPGDTTGSSRSAPERYALLHPRHGVTYELCIVSSGTLGGQVLPTARGSMVVTGPRLARPQITIVASEAVESPISSVMVTTANWERVSGARADDVPVGRAVRDELGPLASRTLRSGQGTTSEITLLQIRNLDGGPVNEVALPTPTRSCKREGFGGVVHSPFCTEVSPTRFVLVPIPGERRPTGICGSSFGGTCEPPSRLERAGSLMLQVDMLDHPASETHTTDWALGETRSFSEPNPPAPPEPGPVPVLLGYEWGVRLQQRLGQDPQGETVGVRATFDQPVLGATFLTDPTLSPERCRREATVELEVPSDAVAFQAEQLCPGHVTLMYLAEVVGGDGEVHVFDQRHYDTTVWLSTPPLEVELIAETYVTDPQSEPGFQVIGGRFHLPGVTKNVSGVDGCRPHGGWSSGDHRVLATSDGWTSLEIGFEASALHVGSPRSCEGFASGSIPDVRAAGAIPQRDLARTAQDAPERGFSRLIPGTSTHVGFTYRTWAPTWRTADVWRDRNVPGAPHQYQVPEELDCGPLWDRQPCQAIRD